MPRFLPLRPERAAAIAAAPAAPASAAPPAISGTFALRATSATPWAAFWAPVVTESVTPLVALPFRFAELDRGRLRELLPDAFAPLRVERELRELLLDAF